MSSAPFSATRLIRLIILSISAYFVSTASICIAFDNDMICAWKRTWHGPNALATPLRGYFVPRLPGRCDPEVCADGWGYAGGAGCAMGLMAWNNGHSTGWMYPPEAGIGFEPVQIERLGQIPNDLELGPAATPSAPSR